MDQKISLDWKYLDDEDRCIDRIVETVITFNRYSSLVSNGILLFLQGERELAFPVDVRGLVLSDDENENELVCKVIEMCVLEEMIELCRKSEPPPDGTPFDKAQAMWILMRIYNALYDLHHIGTHLSKGMRERITEERARTARNRMRLDE